MTGPGPRAIRNALPGWPWPVPTANFLLVLAAGLLLRLGMATEVIIPPHTIYFGHIADTASGGLWPGLVFLLGVFFSLNLLLAAFNLLPLPPLDGSGVVPLFLSEDAQPALPAFHLE